MSLAPGGSESIDLPQPGADCWGQDKPLSLFKTRRLKVGAPSAKPRRRFGSLSDLKRAVAAGRVTEVLSQATEFLEHEPDPVKQGAARLVIAEALLSHGDRAGAVIWARDARANYVTVRHPSAAARCLLIEGRALQLDRAASAELLFRRALRECQAIRPVPRLLQDEIACHLILNLGGASRWAAARSVYREVRPTHVLAPPPLALIYDQVAGRVGSPLARQSAARGMALYQLAYCQAQVATMAAVLGLHLRSRVRDATAVSRSDAT